MSHSPLPTLDAPAGLHSVLFSPELHALLPGYLQRQRWFGNKTRPISSLRLVDAVRIPGTQPFFLGLVAVDQDHYLLLLAFSLLATAHHAAGGMAHVVTSERTYLLHDATRLPSFWEALDQVWKAGTTLSSSTAHLVFEAAPVTQESSSVTPALLSGEQSNSSAILRGRFFAKLYRRLEAGRHPEIEVFRHLTAASFPFAPALRGTIFLQRGDQSVAVGLLQEALVDGVNGWAFTTQLLQTPSATHEGLLNTMQVLGETTARLHKTLSQAHADDLQPQPCTSQDLHGLSQRITTQLNATRSLLAQETDTSITDAEWQAGLHRLKELRQLPPSGLRFHVHGDYHLGQVLQSGGTWFILDFEGEPDRPLAERWQHDLALRDVAGMVRSIEYAVAHTTGSDQSTWYQQAMPFTLAFVQGYFDAAQEAAFLPSPDTREALLWAYLLDKTLYEVRYELGHRPDWAWIPKTGLARLLQECAAN